MSSQFTIREHWYLNMFPSQLATSEHCGKGSDRCFQNFFVLPPQIKALNYIFLASSLSLFIYVKKKRVCKKWKPVSQVLTKMHHCVVCVVPPLLADWM